MTWHPYFIPLLTFLILIFSNTAKPTMTKLDRPRYCPLEDKIEIDSNKLDYECGWGCYGVLKREIK
jgi:hypothetical protein